MLYTYLSESLRGLKQRNGFCACIQYMQGNVLTFWENLIKLNFIQDLLVNMHESENRNASPCQKKKRKDVIGKGGHL